MSLQNLNALPVALLSSLIVYTRATEDFCCLAVGRWNSEDASHLCSVCATSSDAARPPHWCGQSQHNCGQCSGGRATWCPSSPSATRSPATTATTTRSSSPSSTFTRPSTPTATTTTTFTVTTRTITVTDTTTTLTTTPSLASVFFPVTSAPSCRGSEPSCSAPCSDSSDHGVRYVLCTPVKSAKRLLVTFEGIHHAGTGVMINALRLYSLGEQLDFLVLQVNGSEAIDKVADTQRLQWYTQGAAWIKDGTEHSLLIELQREATVDRVHMWTAHPRMTPNKVSVTPLDAPMNHALCAAQLVGWSSRLIEGSSLANVEVVPLAEATSRLLLEFSSAGGQLAQELSLMSVRLYSNQVEVPFVVERMRTDSGIHTAQNTHQIHFGPFQVSGLPVTLSMLLQRPAQVDMIEVRSLATQSLVMKVAPLLDCEPGITTTTTTTSTTQTPAQCCIRGNCWPYQPATHRCCQVRLDAKVCTREQTCGGQPWGTVAKCIDPPFQECCNRDTCQLYDPATQHCCQARKHGLNADIVCAAGQQCVQDDPVTWRDARCVIPASAEGSNKKLGDDRRRLQGDSGFNHGPVVV